MRRRDVVWGVVGLVIVGVSVYSDLQATGPLDVVRDVLAEEDTPVGPPTIDESMQARARTVLGPDGDVVCPGVDRVSSLLGDRPLPPEIVREGIERSVNDVDLTGIECRYGDEVRLGKLDGFEDRVHPLREGGGPVQEGPFPGSVRIDDPVAGTATIVFEDRDEVMEAFVTLPIEQHDHLEALADVALS